MNALNNLKLHLKNKEKGCDYCFDTLCGGKEIRCGSKYKKNYETSGWDKSKDILYCPICQAEIAILEQAIAEIKELQSQQLKVEVSESEKIVRGTPRADCQIREGKLESHDASALEQIPSDISNLLQKQRQDFERILNRIISKLEDGRNQRKEIIDYCKDKKQQLNQPKTEDKHENQHI